MFARNQFKKFRFRNWREAAMMAELYKGGLDSEIIIVILFIYLLFNYCILQVGMNVQNIFN